MEPLLKKQRQEGLLADAPEELALLTDAREPSEPRNYVFVLTDAPECLTRALGRARGRGKFSFPDLYEGDGIDGLAGLLDDDACEEDEDPDQVADETLEYLSSKATEQNALKPPRSLQIAFEFCLRSA